MRADDAGITPRIAAALALIGVVIFTWPALPRITTHLLGHPFGEVDNHLWMATFGGRADAPVRNFPTGFDLPLMDPVHLPFWVVGGLAGPVLAYNAVILLDLLVAALGGWVLSRELGATRGGALVGMTATAFSPFLAGMIEFGITEAWPVGFFALHAALLLRFGRTGHAIHALGAGAALGGFLLSGWYHAAFALVAEVGLAAWALARGPRLRTLAGVVAQGALASAPLLPLWLETRARADIWAPRLSGLTRAVRYTDWAQNPRFGTDLLNLVTPHVDALDVSRTVYLGLGVLALALLGARRRDGLAALGVAVPLLVLALGHWLRVGGEPVGGLGPLPAGWLAEKLPVVQGISHWYRAAGPATVLLGAAAGLGASILVGERRWPAILLAAAVFADAVGLAPVPWPRVHYAPDPPRAISSLPKPGALLQLPFDEGRGLTGIASRRVYDQWQVFHRRSITEHYEGRDELVYTSTVVATWQRACAGVGPLVPVARSPEDELARLFALGIAYVVVHPEYAKESCARTVSQRLGEPTLRQGRIIAWDLGAVVEQLEGGRR